MHQTYVPSPLLLRDDLKNVVKDARGNPKGGAGLTLNLVSSPVVKIEWSAHPASDEDKAVMG